MLEYALIRELIIDKPLAKYLICAIKIQIIYITWIFADEMAEILNEISDAHNFIANNI